jgi:branched-chain amino acid transport system substrate-binding protein
MRADMLRRGMGAALALGLLLLIACNVVESGEAIKIVTSGRSASEVRAVRMALDDEGAKFGNFRIVVQDFGDTVDAQGNADSAKETGNATRAVNDKDVVILIGTSSSNGAKLALPILNQGNLSMVSPTNSYPGLTKAGGEAGEPEKYYPSGKRSFVRVMPADDIQGAVAAKWAKDLGARAAWILDDGEPISKVLADGFAAGARQASLEVKGRTSVRKGETSFRAVTAPIQQAGADLVYFSGIADTNTAQLWKDLRAPGPDLKIMGTDGIFSRDFLNAAQTAAEGTFFSTPALPPEDKLSGKAADWPKRYRDKYNKADPEQFDIYAYEAARLAIGAIKRAGGKDREAVRQALFQTRDFDTLFGKISLDENGDTSLTTLSSGTVKRQGGDLVFDFEKQIALR